MQAASSPPANLCKEIKENLERTKRWPALAIPLRRAIAKFETEPAIAYRFVGVRSVSATTMATKVSMADDLFVLQASLNHSLSKIMEMEKQVESQEQEVSRLEMFVNNIERFHDLRSENEKHFEIEIMSFCDGYLEMRITPNVPTISPGKYEHILAIKMDTTSMTIQAVQLMPEDIPYEDLVADAKALSGLHNAPLLVNGGEGWSKQIFSLISKIQNRIYAAILENATISASAKDPR